MHSLKEIQEKDRPASQGYSRKPAAGGKSIDTKLLGEIEEIMKGAGST